jgi:putative ABC transport system substrate-binding protein
MTDLLKEAAPALRRVAIVRTPQTTSDQLEAALGAARLRGLEVITVEWGGREGYDGALAHLAGNPATGVVQLSTPGFTLDAKNFAEAAKKHRLPTIAFLKTYVRDGVLMSYGPRQETYFSRAALMADRILKGERPANMPIEQPTEFEFAINVRTAQSINLEIPATLLARADEVIE